MNFNLQNKIVLITGAAGGLGRTFALAFAEAEARVVCADRNLAGAEETVALLSKDPQSMLALQVDVTNEASTCAMAQRVIDQWGAIDVLLNNAAIYAGIQRAPFWELEVAEWDRVQAVNLKGAWLCSKAVFPFMRGRGGKIIHIASATVHSGSPRWAHYVSSKAGVIGLTRAMAREAGDEGVMVNAIAPGFTLTDASLDMVADAQSYGVARGALKRAQQPEDVVGAALFLASSASDFMTGQTLIVDGGKQFI